MSDNKYNIITDSLTQAKGCDSLWELQPFLLLKIDIYY